MVFFLAAVCDTHSIYSYNLPGMGSFLFSARRLFQRMGLLTGILYTAGSRTARFDSYTGLSIYQKQFMDSGYVTCDNKCDV